MARKLKIIKIYKVEGDDIKHKIQQIKSKLNTFISWSSINQKCEINQNFFSFPNQSIYNEGVRITHKPKGKIFQLQLIKSQQQKNVRDCFCYTYELSLFENDPSPILKNIGYLQRSRRSRNATIYKSLKYGLEVIVYFNEKDQNMEQIKKGKVELIQTATFHENIGFNNSQILMKRVQALLDQLASPPLENELMYDRMTLKNMGSIQTLG